MMHESDHVRFIQRCRRRWMIWRALEWAGIGATIGSAIGFFILPILFWRGQAAIEPASFALLIGTLSGALLALSRRPSLLQTALKADRQLSLNDLLATAWMSGGEGNDDGFASLVCAQAEEVCRTLSPNALIVRRLGGRAWGGIGIASSLVLTLAMISAESRPTQANVNPKTDKTPLPLIGSNETSERATDRASRQSLDRAGESAQRNDDRSLQEHDDDGSTRAGNSSASRGPSRSNSKGDGAGSMAGRTDDALIPHLAQNTSSANDATNGLAQARGAGGHQTNPGSSPPAMDGIAGNSTTSSKPWQSATWKADRSEAIKDVQSGKTPDDYRDLVREYFDVQHPTGTQ